MFGHLSPPFLMEELDVLADEVRKRQAAAAAAATRIGAQEEPDEGSEMPPPLEGVTGMWPFFSSLGICTWAAYADAGVCSPAGSYPGAKRVEGDLLMSNVFPPCAVVIMHIKDELYPTPRPRPPPSSKPQPVRLETETAAVAAADPSSSSSNSGPRRSPRLGSAQPSSLASGSLPTGKDEDEDAEEEEAEEEGEDDDDETVQERIERELNELERTRRTGVKFLLAQQGMRIGEFLISSSGLGSLRVGVGQARRRRGSDSLFLLSRTRRVLSAPLLFLSTPHCVSCAYAARWACSILPLSLFILPCVLLARPALSMR